MWFRSIFQSSKRAADPARRPAAAARLRLEALDDRIVPSAPAVGPQGAYAQTNLVSDIPGLALLTDPNLKNPWGTAFGRDRSFSISDQKTNVSTQYAVTEAGVTAESPTLTIPTTAAGPHGPTGEASNDTPSFLVNGTPASFIYANTNGTLSAWNSTLGTTAQIVATVPGARYTGLDLETTPAGDFLYAANHFQSRIDVFDGSFNRVTLPPGAFVDPELPSGMSPFNVESINGDLYVTYGLVGQPKLIAAPEGVGAVAVFDTSGNFIGQLISGGKLASPWGITLAPPSFGEFGGALLVGNFSYVATEINAFDPTSGAYLGTLTDGSGNALLAGDNGLWDLTFGIGGNGGLPTTLYFATGLNNETDGLFGAITPAPRPGIAPGRVSGQDGGSAGAAAPAGGATLSDPVTELPPAFQGLDSAITRFQPVDSCRVESPVFALNFGKANPEILPGLDGLERAAGRVTPDPIAPVFVDSPVFFNLADGLSDPLDGDSAG